MARSDARSHHKSESATRQTQRLPTKLHQASISATAPTSSRGVSAVPRDTPPHAQTSPTRRKSRSADTLASPNTIGAATAKPLPPRATAFEATRRPVPPRSVAPTVLPSTAPSTHGTAELSRESKSSAKPKKNRAKTGATPPAAPYAPRGQTLAAMAAQRSTPEATCAPATRHTTERFPPVRVATPPLCPNSVPRYAEAPPAYVPTMSTNPGIPPPTEFQP